VIRLSVPIVALHLVVLIIAGLEHVIQSISHEHCTAATQSVRAGGPCSLVQCYDIEETVAHPIAVEQLTSVGFDANEARDLIEQLWLHGYLYENDTGLRLTPGYEHGLRGSQSRS
jgi:hypothetical protein